MKSLLKSPKTPSRLPTIYSVDEAAEYLDVSGKTVLALIRRKILPSIKAGREHRITEPDLLTFVTGGRR